jgi:hypothetical protein
MLQKLFSKIDGNGDGSIDKSELTSFLQDAQSSTQSGSTQTVDLNSALSALDTNSDGSITQQEFTDSVSSLLGKLREQATSNSAQDASPPPEKSSGSHGHRMADVLLAALSQYQSTQSSGSTQSSQLSVAA